MTTSQTWMKNRSLPLVACRSFLHPNPLIPHNEDNLLIFITTNTWHAMCL